MHVKDSSLESIAKCSEKDTESERAIKGPNTHRANQILVVGADLDIGGILGLVEKTVVGRFAGKVVRPTTLEGLLDATWVGMIGYRPVFHTLA
jgi:hypothetical protein